MYECSCECAISSMRWALTAEPGSVVSATFRNAVMMLR